MKRGKAACIFLVLLVVLFASGVRANFACGVLNGTEDLSASWFDVRAHYSDNPSEHTLCEVSPDENKFCCDPHDIEGETWEIGREITAEVFEHGYAAGPVSLVVSGEGYDVFPTMHLEKLITIHSPNESVYVGLEGLLVNVSVAGVYDGLAFLINYSGEIVNEEWGYDVQICENCTHAEFYLEGLPYGHYELIFITTSGVEEVRESVEFDLLEYLHFSREIECRRCGNRFVYSGQVVEMTVGMEASHPVSGRLRDYYPIDWKLVTDTDAYVAEYSDTHNEVGWEIEGENAVERTYYLLAPRVFFTQKYYFQSSFESYFSERHPVVVYWFYRFWPYPNKYLRMISGINYYSRYARVSPENPFVMDLEDEDLVRLAIFPNKELENVYAFVHKKSPVRKSGARVHFVLGTNIEKEEIENILVQFKVEKPGFWREVGGVEFYRYVVEEDSWKLVEAERYEEDEDYVYFKVYVDDKGAFAIEPFYTW